MAIYMAIYIYICLVGLENVESVFYSFSTFGLSHMFFTFSATVFLPFSSRSQPFFFRFQLTVFYSFLTFSAPAFAHFSMVFNVFRFTFF